MQEIQAKHERLHLTKVQLYHVLQQCAWPHTVCSSPVFKYPVNCSERFWVKLPLRAGQELQEVDFPLPCDNVDNQ